MLTAAAISGIMAAAPEVFRGITSIVQNQKANKAAKELERPVMSVPKSIQDYVNSAKAMSMTGLPGKQIIEGDIERSTANALRLGKEYGGATDVASIYANEQMQKRKVGVEDSTANMANIQAYQNALRTKGQYEDKAFDYNKVQPYAEATAAVAGQKNAANTNAFEAVKNLAGIGVNLMSPGQKLDETPISGGGATTPGAQTAPIATGATQPINIDPNGQAEAMKVLMELLKTDPTRAQAIIKQFGIEF